MFDPVILLQHFMFGVVPDLQCACTIHTPSRRTFLVKAPRIMQAKALLEGRTQVISDDLRVLELLTTFRVPSHVHRDMAEIIDGVVLALDKF